MTEQTFILGKDAALEDSISKFQQKLTALGLILYQMNGLYTFVIKIAHNVFLTVKARAKKPR